MVHEEVLVDGIFIEGYFPSIRVVVVICIIDVTCSMLNRIQITNVLPLVRSVVQVVSSLVTQLKLLLDAEKHDPWLPVML